MHSILPSCSIYSILLLQNQLFTNNNLKSSIMSDSKTYVFQPDSGTNALAMLAPTLANRGMDAATISALMNNNGGFGNNGMWPLFLLFLMGWGGGNGWGGNRGTDFLSTQMANDTGRELLQQAIAGNANAIGQLATNLHVDTSQIQGALCALQGNVQNVAAQVGMTTQQVINAIQSGNCQIINQMAQSCCDIKNSITTQGYENRLANIEQTNILASKIDAQTTMLNDKFCELKTREMQNKIDSLSAHNLALQNQISNLNQNSVTAQIVTQATAPIASALAHVQGEVSDIKRTIPSTITIPLPLAQQAGLTLWGLDGTGSLWS